MTDNVEQGWLTVELGDLGRLHCGQSPSKSDVNTTGAGEVYVTGPEQYKDGKIVSEKWTTNPKRIAPDRSIFITVKGSVGAMFKGSRAAIGRDIYAFEPSEEVNIDFVFWALREGINKITSSAKGDIPGISKPDILEHIIAFPSRKTQDVLVEKIEAMFEEIDAGTQSLRAAQAKLGLYRQSILKSAFEGRLTADWRAQNADKLEDPETLLSRIQYERDTRFKAALDDWQKALTQWREDGEQGKKPAKPKRPRDIQPKSVELGIHGWALLPLGLLIDEPTYGTSKKCDYDGGSKGVLRIPNISKGVVDASDLKSADFDEAELKQYRLQDGDVLTTRSNGSLSLVGKPALVREIDTDFLYAGYLIRLRPLPDCLVPKVLAYLMTEPNIRGQIESAAKSTSGVNNINAKELQELQVPICSPAEQTEIVRILDAKLEAADALEAEITAALTRTDALRQSVLKKAFSGRLVPQDPTDEPASALLDRIKASRAAAPKANRKRKTSA